MERYDELTKRMEKEHPFLTDATDSFPLIIRMSTISQRMRKIINYYINSSTC